MSDDVDLLALESGPFVVLPAWILDHAGLSDGAIRLYLVLAERANREGASWPSRRSLADRMGVSMNTADRRLKELEDAKLLTRRARGDGAGRQTSNLWTLRVHRSPRLRREVPTSGEDGVPTSGEGGTRSRGTRYERPQNRGERGEQRPGPALPTRTSDEIAAELAEVEIASPETVAETIAAARRVSSRRAKGVRPWSAAPSSEPPRSSGSSS